MKGEGDEVEAIQNLMGDFSQCMGEHGRGLKRHS